MMPLDQQQLIERVAMFYPHRIDPSDPNFTRSLEVKAYDEAWERAEQGFDRWRETVSAIRQALPGTSVSDTTPGRFCGSFRCVAYVQTQSLVGGAKLETMVIGYQSVLAPVYGLSCAQRVLTSRPAETACPWRAASIEITEDLKPIAEVMAMHIERGSGFQRLSVELARVRVPGIHVHIIPPGEATLFDALFDPDPSNVP